MTEALCYLCGLPHNGPELCPRCFGHAGEREVVHTDSAAGAAIIRRLKDPAIADVVTARIAQVMQRGDVESQKPI